MLSALSTPTPTDEDEDVVISCGVLWRPRVSCSLSGNVGISFTETMNGQEFRYLGTYHVGLLIVEP